MVRKERRYRVEFEHYDVRVILDMDTRRTRLIHVTPAQCAEFARQVEEAVRTVSQVRHMQEDEHTIVKAGRPGEPDLEFRSFRDD